MFKYKEENQYVPTYVWLDSVGRERFKDLDGGDLKKQIDNLSRLPFVYHHIAIMPDSHLGYGMPIGGILATKDYIIPNAVGVDISCGMRFVETDIPVKLLRQVETPSGILAKQIGSNILRNIPVGFKKYKNRQENDVVRFLTAEKNIFSKEELENMYYQIGTLGGGNHFISIQEDEEGKLCIMIHSGSRHMGYVIAKHFNKVAEELNKKYFSRVPEDWDLAFLPVDSKEGQEYINHMNLAMDFAKENRKVMMEKVKNLVFNNVKKYTDIDNVKIEDEFDVHHNYADIENHFGENVWVHRKGAIRVREGEKGIVPGSMGSNSYIVEGLGNEDSFYSCSHGAGRRMSRTEAKDKFNVQEMMEDFKNNEVYVMTPNKKEDLIDEYKKAYKDLDVVMEDEKDLVKIIKKLDSVVVIKG